LQISECVATIPATLKFTVKDCDPTTGEPDSEEGYNDDYQLEDIDITVADYVQRVMKVRFLSFHVAVPGSELEYMSRDRDKCPGKKSSQI
jgi:coatomer protein complex subunit gamma